MQNTSSNNNKRKFIASQTMTITFGDVAENHVRMQKIGTMAEHGFSRSDLIRFKNWMEERVCCLLIY
jgi:hypothetical protein